jgi:hypothetical protein
MIREGVYRAESEEEKLAVYRFRYDIYVEEMGRYRGVADHDQRTLSEPEDATARIFYAARDGAVLGTSRLSWGGDAAFSPRQIEQYQLKPFLDEVAPEAVAVGERAMVAPQLRGSELFQEIGALVRDFIQEKRIQLVFGACEPHLLSRYLGRGARTYSSRNINSPESGYLIPIVTVIEDIEYFRRINAPGLEDAKDYGSDARVPACVDRLITKGGGVLSERLTSLPAYYAKVDAALSELTASRISALDGLTEEEAFRCLGKSNIIECQAGDRILKKGGVARNMFIVLDGILEVRDGERLLRVLSPGDVFGEIAFLLERPRTADVYAATDGVRILSLSESVIRKMIENDAEVAAHLLINISKILCLRIVQGK